MREYDSDTTVPFVLHLAGADAPILRAPPGWPCPIPPLSGETLMAHALRAAAADAFLQTALARVTADRRLPVPRLMRPGELTKARLVTRYPDPRDRVSHVQGWLGYSPVGKLAAGWWTGWLDLYRTGAAVLQGQRDGATVRGLVPIGLLSSEHVTLRLHELRLEPVPWRGRPHPPDLAPYRNLTSWPRAAVKLPAIPYEELLEWWRGYVAQFPNPDERPDKEAQQEAAKAAAALLGYAAPSDRVMQRLRADPFTPREWSEGGRRPRPRQGE